MFILPGVALGGLSPPPTYRLCVLTVTAALKSSLRFDENPRRDEGAAHHKATQNRSHGGYRRSDSFAPGRPGAREPRLMQCCTSAKPDPCTTVALVLACVSCAVASLR